MALSDFHELVFFKASHFSTGDQELLKTLNSLIRDPEHNYCRISKSRNIWNISYYLSLPDNQYYLLGRIGISTSDLAKVEVIQ